MSSKIRSHNQNPVRGKQRRLQVGGNGISKLIANAESIDLNENEIKWITNGAANILAYHELAPFTNISQMFNGKPCCILLYETKENFGHWTCLIDRGQSFEFFDSYGFAPDAELNFATYDHTPYLTNLLKASGKPVTHNTVDLQKWASDVNTCGRWASTRCAMRNYNNEQFAQLFTDNAGYNPDFYCSALTFLYTIHQQQN